MNNENQKKSSTKPIHTPCKKVYAGKKPDFETIDVAWERETAGFYSKVYGTKITEGGFTHTQTRVIKAKRVGNSPSHLF